MIPIITIIRQLNKRRSTKHLKNAPATPSLIKLNRSVQKLEATGITGISIQESDSLITLTTPPYPEGTPWYKRQAPSTLLALASGIIAVIYLIYELTIAGHLGFPQDEAWINLVYARNFFKNLAFEFNLGEHTAGPTAPFWTVFLAFTYSLFKDPYLSAKLLGAIFLFLTGYYAFRLLRTKRIDYFSSLIGGVLVLLLPRLDWAELSGMEVTLSSALVMGGLWWYLEEERPWGKYITGAAFALAALTRPESILVFGILILYTVGSYFLSRRRNASLPSRRLDDLFIAFAVFVFILIPIGITNYVLSGSIFPTVFSASLKGDSIIAVIAGGNYSEALWRFVHLDSIAYFFSSVLLQDNPALAVAIVIAGYTLIRDQTLRTLSASRIFTLGITILLLFPYARMLFLGLNDTYGNHGRWVAFLSPVYVVTGIAALQIIAKRYVFRELSEKAIILVTTGALALLGATVLLILIPPSVGVDLGSTPYIIACTSLLFLLAGFAVIGLNYIGFDIATQKHRRFTEDPKLLGKLTYSEANDFMLMEDDLPRHHTKILQSILLILLSWHLALMPLMAHVYANEVQATNEMNVATAKWVGGVSEPTDVLVSNEVGALGWFTNKRVIDLHGFVTQDVGDSVSKLGESAGLTSIFNKYQADYFVDFGDQLSTFTSQAQKQKLLAPLAYTDSISSIGTKLDTRVKVYRINQK